MLDGLKTKYPFTPTGRQPLAGLRVSLPSQTALSTPDTIAPQGNLLSSIGDYFKKLVAKPKAMEFKIGEGLTPELLAKAEEIIRTPAGGDIGSLMTPSQTSSIAKAYLGQRMMEKQGKTPETKISPELGRLALEEQANIAMGFAMPAGGEGGFLKGITKKAKDLIKGKVPPIEAAKNEAEIIIEKINQKWIGGEPSMAETIRFNEAKLAIGKIAKKYDIPYSELEKEIFWLPKILPKEEPLTLKQAQEMLKPEVPPTIAPEAQWTKDIQSGKYANSEEFVKAQPTAYHGTSGDFETFKPFNKVPADFKDSSGQHTFGTYFADNKDLAGQFGKNILERKLNVSKPFDVSGVNSFDELVQKLGLNTEKNAWEIRNMKSTSYFDKLGGESESSYRALEALNKKFDVVKQLKKQGYDALIFADKENGIAGKTTVVFDTNKILTKSQLTDIWNKAQAVKGAGEVEIPISEISAKTKSKITGIPEVPLPVSPKGLPISEELSSVDKITQALKESKPLRGKQEKLYSAERSQRMAKALAVGEKTTGEAGYFRELGQLKGELPKVQFDEIRSKIGQTDIDNLFGQIKDSKLLSFWDSVNARGGLVKILEGRVPTEGELTLLSRVFPKEFIDTILSKRDLFTKFKDAAFQLANIPRSVMASFDLSAPFRQGLFLIAHPKRFFGSFLDMFKAFGSENAFKVIQEDIVKKPTFELMRDNKLALTEMDSILTQREEKFMSNWAEKIPLVGKVIRASGRAYTGFLNKLRADVFDDLITKADKLGLAPRSNPQLTKEIANFVNVASGRGSLGSLQPAANALNSFFFSPKLMSSRLTLLNPGYYIKVEPFVRREAIKSLLTVIGVGTTILGLSKLAGADVGIDPRSADFGKIIVGKTRLDVWGGFQQYIRMFGQLLSGQYVSSVTGKLVTLGEGYKPLTRFDILQRQIEAKEAPIFSFITTLLKGQNFLGEKIKLTDEIKNRFIPMAISDIYDIYKNDPEMLPLSGMGMFGFGLQTYSGEIPTEKEKKDTYKISQILGEQAKERESLSNASALMYQELKKMPKDKAKEEFDKLIKENPEMTDKINDLIKDEQLGLTYVEKMLKQLGVENGQRAKYIVEELNKLSQEEKKSYYQNLIDKKVITKEVGKQVLKLLHQ